jgi:hypothetical protein
VRRSILLVLACLFAVGNASAHDLGYSTSEVQIGDDGTVSADFTFAAADLASSTSADFLARGVELRADDATCNGTVDRWQPIGGDGIDVVVTFHCPPKASVYVLTMYLVSELGVTHRNVARMTHGSTTAQAILSPKERALRLEIPRPATATIADSRPGLVVYVGPVALIAILLYLRFRRRD